jgi:hypothetical protein
MVSSVEASLKRLQTDRIDLYWAHVSDGVTPLEEIVRGSMIWCVPARLDVVSAVPPVFPYTALNDPRIKDLITGSKFEQIDAPLQSVA